MYGLADRLQAERERYEDAYVDWCEREGLDPSEDHSQEFEEAMEADAEDAAEARAEARAGY